MTKREFRAALTVLWSIDRSDVPVLTDAQWLWFRNDPIDFYLRADDPTADAIWRAAQPSLQAAGADHGRT